MTTAAERNKARRHRRRAMGLCIRCDEPIQQGGRCSFHHREHLDVTNARIERLRAEAREKGMCVTCLKRKTRPERVTCASCATRQKAIDKKRTAA